MSKWMLAIIGYTFFRFPGALIGYFLGGLLEGYRSKNGSIRNISSQDFELNLLALASLVIKADGRVSKQELDYVRSYFVSAYGKERANTTFKIFNDNINKNGISPSNISKLFNSVLKYESRLQVIHFLFGIAKAVIENSPIEIKNTSSALEEEVETVEQIPDDLEPVEGSQNELEVSNKSVHLPFGIHHIPTGKTPNLLENANKVQINSEQKLPFGIEYIVDKSE